MIAVIDYDAGNLKSVENALLLLGEKPVATRDPELILGADRVILPGVGSFGDAMRNLTAFGLVDPIRKAAKNGTPLLGICLGMQLFFESSEESPGVEGLSILPGRILRIPPASGLKIPHMGWNSLRIREGAKLYSGVAQGEFVYFVHSYYLKADVEDHVAATTEYGVKIDASVEAGNIFGCQFHPEKSGDVGLCMLKNFAKISSGGAVC